MKILTTSELHTHIEEMFAKLAFIATQDGVFRPLNVFFGESTTHGQDGSFCYADEQGYHYGVYERGILIMSITTQSLVEIAYYAISSDIFNMTGIYEAKNRISGQDFRRLWFRKIIEYWMIIGDEYADLAKQRLDDALAKAPFVD